MKIEHIGVWTNNLEEMKAFYVKYFDGIPSKMYHNKDKDFKSYFLCFESGTRIEIMKQGDFKANAAVPTGYAHLAFKVDTIFGVMKKTEDLRQDGFEIVSEPRTTGDGYFESVVADPEGNLIEIVK